MTDDELDYDVLDPGICDVVRLLRSHAFDTSDSGDGVTKINMPCALSMPHVFIPVDPTQMISATLRLHRVVTAAGVTVSPNGQGNVYIEASYDPADDSALIMLYGLDDAGLAKARATLPS